MQLTPKIPEKHTFILITDPESEYFLGFGFLKSTDLFNLPFPEDYVIESNELDKDNYLRKTVYSGTVNFNQYKNIN